MVVRLNRNTRTTTGEYFVRIIKETMRARYIVMNENTHEIDNKKIIPLKLIDDEKVKKEIEEFKFFVQYGNFKELENYKDGKVSYNPEVPIYSAQYQLKNSDYNVEQLLVSDIISQQERRLNCY